VALGIAAGGGNGGAVKAQKSVDPTQQKNPTSPPVGMPADDVPPVPDNPMSGSMKEQRTKAFNVERHKRLEDDVARLQTLTSELKSEVDKANKDELSLDVMRKAAEIEKLAHEVQNRMKN
jgi:hypothetical protein